MNRKANENMAEAGETTHDESKLNKLEVDRGECEACDADVKGKS